MALSKFTISGLDSVTLMNFFSSSILYGDQTLDIVKDKFYCKASNKSMSNIIYREFSFGDKVSISANPPEHVKFFLQNYGLLHKILQNMQTETTVSMTFHYEENVCKKVTVSNSYINFDLNGSELALSNYIEDERFAKIKNPENVKLSLKLSFSKIKEIKSLHKVAKSDNEKLDIVRLLSDGKDFDILYKNVKSEWKFNFKESDGLTKNDISGKFVLPLDIFNNLGSSANFLLEIVELQPNARACYLRVSEHPDSFINITRIENDN